MRGFHLKLLQDLRFRDRLLWGYNLLLLVYLWAAPHPYHHRLAWSLGHLAVLVIWPWLARSRPGSGLERWRQLLHDFLPLIMVMPLYAEVTLLNESFLQFDMDAILVSWDRVLGLDGLGDWLASGRHLVLDEFMHAVYFSFYLLYVIPILYFHRRDRPAFEAYLSGILFVSFCHYAVLVFLPANGPVPLHTGRFPEGLFFIPVMELIYRVGEHGGCAFPSEHMATALFLSLLLKELLKGRRLIPLFIWNAFIAVSTVYCSYHYSVDVLGGLASGILLFLVYRKRLLPAISMVS